MSRTGEKVPLLFTLRSNSNGFCRCFACRIGKIPQPLRYLTEFSVQKIPTVNCNKTPAIPLLSEFSASAGTSASGFAGAAPAA